jgi:hypothetical protein
MKSFPLIVYALPPMDDIASSFCVSAALVIAFIPCIPKALRMTIKKGTKLALYCVFWRT